MANKTVEEIVEKAKSGDMSAFDLLYREYSEKLLKYVVKLGVDSYDAEDIVSESFMEAIEHIGDLKSNAFFSTWLHTIAKNKVYTMKKKEQKHTRVDFSSDEGDEQNDALDIAVSEAAEYNGDTIMLPEDYAENEDIKQILADTINSLNPDQRDAVYLFYYKNNSISEIAEQAGVSENTIKSRLSLARKYMERKLKALQKGGVTLCAVPIPVILNIVVSESKLKAAAPVVTTAAGGATSGAAVSAVSGKIGALIAAGIMIGGGVGIYSTLSDRSGNIHKGDIRTADSSSVMISDASSSDSRRDWDPNLIKVVDTDTVESTIAVDDASSQTDSRPTNTNQGNTRTTQPNQQAQPTQQGQQVITYYDDVVENDVGYEGDNEEQDISNEDNTEQNENWTDVELGRLSDSISKYSFTPNTNRWVEVESCKHDATSGSVMITFYTNANISDLDMQMAYNIGGGEGGGLFYLDPISLTNDGSKYTALYQDDHMKTNHIYFSFCPLEFIADYIDDIGTYQIDKYYAPGSYRQNMILDNTNTVTLNSNTNIFFYEFSGFSSEYTLERYDEVNEYYNNEGKGKKIEDLYYEHYTLSPNFEDFFKITEFKVQSGNKFFEVKDGILYFKKDGYYWLVWAPEKTYNKLSFPNNVIAYNAFEMKKIKVSNIDQLSVGNNSWMKTDTEFLETLGLN